MVPSNALSLIVDPTPTMASWNTDMLLTPKAIQRCADSSSDLSESDETASLSDGSALIDLTVTTAVGVAPIAVSETDTDDDAVPHSLRKKRSGVFALLANGCRRLRRGAKSGTSPAKKQKKFKYKGELLYNMPDQFLLQAITRCTVFGAANMQDAASFVADDWTARGVELPQYEFSDKHTLLVLGSTVWLAEHQPEELQRLFAERAEQQ